MCRCKCVISGTCYYDMATPGYLDSSSPTEGFIHECNHNCKCGSDCLNRLVQNSHRNGPVGMYLEKTKQYGWGVFADKNISENCFLCEVGIFITIIIILLFYNLKAWLFILFYFILFI